MQLWTERRGSMVAAGLSKHSHYLQCISDSARLESPNDQQLTEVTDFAPVTRHGRLLRRFKQTPLFPLITVLFHVFCQSGI